MANKKVKQRRKIRAEEFRRLSDLKTNVYIDLYTHNGKETIAPPDMPSELTILGQKFKIRYHTRIFDQRKEKLRLAGCVFYAYQVIFIDPENSYHEMKRVLYHEVSHVYIKHTQSKGLLRALSDLDVEDLCDTFGAGIYDLVVNNASLT